MKFAPEGRGTGSGNGANLGQNIFHRPASSGQYAIVLNLDLYRIGKNDITLSYVLDLNERRRRIQALLKSVLLTFIKPNGAQRNTQSPHIVNFEGSLTCSNSTYPSPQVSPLNLNYQKEIEGVAGVFNKLNENSVTIHDLTAKTPYNNKNNLLNAG